MDLTKIKSAILNQLSDTNSLYSLKLQNHIYGCFIIMEDLAQERITLSDMVLSTPKYKFDLDKQFHMIGIRYGFVMDTHIALDGFTQEYHDLWLEFFKHVYLTKDLTEVDRIEDCIIELVQTIFKNDEAFFIHALETGSLPQEWIEKVLGLINGAANAAANVAANTNVNTSTTENALTTESNNHVIDSYTANMPIDSTINPTKKTLEINQEKTGSDEEVKNNAITKAHVEKPIIRVRQNHLSKTRRANIKTDTKKKNLSKTRRH